MKWFVSAVAQEDNLGDLEIRRHLVSWLARCGTVHVYTQGVGDDFVKALDLPSSAQTYADRRAFTTTLLRPAGVERRCLVFAPGEFPLSLSTAHLTASLTNLGTVAALRLSGGSAAIVGRSYVGESAVMTTLQRALHGMSRTWLRERGAAERWGTAYMPDIALSAEPRTAEKLGRIAFSFRGDRTAGPRAVPLLRALAGSHDHELLAVTQVARDQVRNEELAGSLGGTHSAWRHGDLSTERDRVLTAYLGANVVVSDRFHALVFGMVHGAVPIAICTEAGQKVRRHFASLGLGELCLAPEDVDRAQAVLAAEATWRDRVGEVLADSRRDLAAVRSALVESAFGSAR